ncbi:MAG: hypothetical protein EOP34_11425 [Rickettsiales bacterium]|nr:MAG: hypothetical protein EOP34_11425 [Rickettsiales bacterium]
MNTFQRVSFSGSYSSVLTEAMPDLTKRELTILMLLIIPTVILGIYPAAILDGLHYSVSTVLYHSDTIVAFAGAPLATEQTEVLARAQKFEVTAAQSTSSSETLRELSNDNPEVLNRIVQNETAAITDSKKAIVEELTRVLPDSPGDAMQFTQQITFVNKTAQRAIDELNSAAETALEQIDYEQPLVKSVLLLIDIALVDCLVYYAAAFPVLVKLCLHKQSRELVVFYAL